MLKNHFFVSQCDGGLYDTRRPNWINAPALRPGYARIVRKVRGNNTALKAAIRAEFAWSGGYELFGITQDGGTLCCGCMRSEYRQIAYSRRHDVNDGWNVEVIGFASEYDSGVCCDHCGRFIVDASEGD